MKAKLSHVLYGKIMATLFGVALILFGVCFGGDDASKVYAASTLDTTTYTGYAFKTYTGTEAKEYVGLKVPDAEEGYVFAGWYTTATCKLEEAVKSNDSVEDSESATYYAKYVPEDVLSIRVQVSTKEDVNDEVEGNQRNMRVVSSVDTLNYSKVGFRLKYKEDNLETNSWIYKKNTADIVYERIESATEGDEYKFSPKVVDTKSKYFMTATWKGDENTGISEADYNTNYYIRAYWVTLDGMTVYGPTRYVSVNDGLNTNIVNMSVKNSTWNKESTLTTDAYSGATVSVAYQDGAYAHLKINLGGGINRTDVLKSVTKFTITNTADSTSEEAIYRNLYTKYTGTGTEDKSWYEVYGTTPKEYVIATAADLYGFASLMNSGKLFANQTVYMVADIEVNKGTASPNGWSESYTVNGTEYTGTSYEWTPIGGTYAFAGDFDGQGHTISGICETTVVANMGLFGYTASASELRSFRLTNSYFGRTASGGTYIGSVVARCEGSMDSVYSDAMITTIGGLNGGIIGGHWSTSTSTITNCWYAGTMTINASGTTGSNSGGIMGKTLKGTVNIENCLFSGKITNTTTTSGNQRTGGFVGDSAGTLVIKNSLNSGEFVYNDGIPGVCRLVGYLENAAITVNNTYYTTKGYNGTVEYAKADTITLDATTLNYTEVEEADITGMCAYYNDILVNTDAWVVTKATPQLALFGEELTVPENANIDWFTGLDKEEYIICNSANDNVLNVEELYGFAFLSNAGINFEGSTVYMANDVTVNEGAVSDWEANEFADLIEWTPIGEMTNEFAGTFDGQMNSVRGLYINTAEVGAGLFRGTTEGSAIRNLKLENSYINSTNSNTYAIVGGVVAACSGSISNVYSNAVVKATQSLAGGIVGQMHGANAMSIDNCWFDGSVTAKGTCGGIIAAVSTGVVTMNNCLNTGTVSGTANSVGGLCGRTFRSTEKYNLNDVATTVLGLQMSNCLNAGKVTCATWTGSVIGGIQHITNSTMSVSNVYATNESYMVNDVPTWCGRNKTSDGTAATTVAESDITGVRALDSGVLVNTEAWVMTETTPALALFAEELVLPEDIDITWYTKETTTEYVICDSEENAENVKQLYGFAYLVNHGVDFDNMTVKMANSVTVNEGEYGKWAVDTTEGLKLWTPIGTEEFGFAGIFDGGMNNISGLFIKSAEQGVGLFKYTTEGSELKDFKLVNSYIWSTHTGNALAGSVVGSCAGNLTNVYSNAYVRTSATYVGGIAGQLHSTGNILVDGCWFAGTVHGRAGSSNAGGIAGLISSGNITMQNCLSSGKVIVLENSSDKLGTSAGGFFGRTQANVDRWALTGSSTVSVTLDRCLATGVIQGKKDIGSAIGWPQKGTVTIAEDSFVYATTNSVATNGTSKAIQGVATTNVTGTITPVDIDSIKGVTAYSVLIGLDFSENGKWALINGATPQLRAFADEAKLLAGDFSWYSADATEYTIDTADELIGFSSLANYGTTYSGKTIKLGADIDLNEDWTASTKAEAPEVEWNPVGMATAPFAGIFDGQNHSISGVYVSSDDSYIGLFGVTTESSEIKNLRLMNSYFEQQVISPDDVTEVDGYVGSIAGWIRGDMTNVYSNAIVTSGNRYTGGLISQVCPSGDFTNPVNIKNCWFDGQIVTGTYGRYIGGIAAGVLRGTTCNIENTLFTGTINASYNGDKAIYLGGIVGEVKSAATELNLKSVVSAGKIVGNHTSNQCNAVVGRVRTKVLNDNTTNAATEAPKFNMENVFATRDCYASTYGVETAKGTKVITEAVTDETETIITPAVTEEIIAKVTVTGTVARTNGDDRLLGYIPNKTIESDKENPVVSSLNFAEAWIMRTNGVPIPKTLSDVAADKVSSVDATALAKEIGLDYWNKDAKITDAEDYGAGNYLATYSTTASLTYAGYLQKLESLGFTKYADNASSDMHDDGVCQATYKKESPEWILNVTWVKNESKIYISINTDKTSLDDNLVSAAKEGSDAISLSMLEITNTEDDKYGNSFVFELPDGHFIVSDGARVEDGLKLIDYMKGLAGTTNGVQNPVYIDAWIITHYHGDHCGALAMFNDYPAYRENVYVDAIYVSEPSSYAADYWEADRVTVMNNVYKGISYLTKTDKVTRPNIYQMHMGQRYYFNGITMDVVDTQEQHPVATWADTNEKLPDPFNTSSTSCIFSFADGNGATKKTFIGGDATNVNLEYMIMAYGENNNTLANIDVFVALHHGHNTTATYGTQDVEHPLGIGTATVQGVANTNWADFLLKNTNNADQKFDVVLFPYYKVYELNWEYGKGYIDNVGSKAYPYNIGEMNRYLYEDGKATMYYTYGYEDMTDATESTPHGTVRLTFGTTIDANILGSWK